MSDQVPPGYYLDSFGELKRDRRRKENPKWSHDSYGGEERRKKARRVSDGVNLEREHEELIEDALEEFAAQREG